MNNLHPPKKGRCENCGKEYITEKFGEKPISEMCDQDDQDYCRTPNCRTVRIADSRSTCMMRFQNS